MIYIIEVGNGMTYGEDKAHFSLWCMLAAPLMAGNDLRKMSEQTKAVLTNKDVIAIDQDALGIEGFKYYSFDGLEMWIKPLANNSLAVCFLNRSDRRQKVTYDWKAHQIKDTISNMNIDFNKSAYGIFDLWIKKPSGNTNSILKTNIEAHDVLLLRLNKQ